MPKYSTGSQGHLHNATTLRAQAVTLLQACARKKVMMSNYTQFPDGIYLFTILRLLTGDHNI